MRHQGAVLVLCPLPTTLPATPCLYAVYFHVRERQLAYQIHVAAQHPQSAVWRAPPAAPQPPARLLRRRCWAPLAVRIPRSATGVEANDCVVFLRSVEVEMPCPRPPPPPPPPPAPPAAAAAALAAAPAHAAVAAPAWAHVGWPSSATAPLYRLTTPPPSEQPAKRARLSGSAAYDISRPAPLGAHVQRAPTPMPGHLAAHASQPALCTYLAHCGRRRRPPLPAAEAHLPPASLLLPMPLAASLAAPPLCCSCWDTAQPPQQRQQGSDESPAFSWLRKIRCMLESAPPAHPVFC